MGVCDADRLSRLLRAGFGVTPSASDRERSGLALGEVKIGSPVWLTTCSSAGRAAGSMLRHLSGDAGAMLLFKKLEPERQLYSTTFVTGHLPSSPSHTVIQRLTAQGGR
jgi:hypothetical protein